MGQPINWIAVFVSALIGVVVPAVWYAPKLFGNVWSKLSGMNPEDPRDFGPSFAVAVACNLVMAAALAGFMNYFGSQTFVQGLLAGAELWLGFVATNFVVDYKFAQRPFKLTLINIGHSLISLSLMGGVLASWK